MNGVQLNLGRWCSCLAMRRAPKGRVLMVPVVRTIHTTRSNLAADTRSIRQSESSKQDDAIPFSTSDASKWKASQTFENTRDHPKYEPIIVSLSLSTLLIYFCILREENDIDEKLSRSLYDHVPQLEEQQLKVTLEYQKMNGHDTTAVERRLEEIRANKERANIIK